ncbi:hypothetical protein KQI84_02610 [bacterium]|nr:hypothetical protein [bacterium]
MTRHTSHFLTQNRTNILRLVAVVLLLALSHPGWAAGFEDKECMKCHGQSWIAQTSPSGLAGMVRIREGETRVMRPEDEIAALYISDESLKHSAHAGLNCTDCHSGIESLPHSQRLAALNCSDCHVETQDAVAAGPHGSKVDDGLRRPNCNDCHGDPHEITLFSDPRTYTEALQSVENCMTCHDEEAIHPFNPGESYRDNAHGEALYLKGLPLTATCVDCHGHHEMLPAEDPESPLNAFNVPDTCGKCHEGVEDVYYTSVHGQHLADGDEEAATCTKCHHSHGIKPIGEPFLMDVAQECSHCHIDLGRTYMLSYHGKAVELGYGNAAVCSSCHGAHDILPPDDPRSHVAAENLQETCSKCHDNVNANFVKYIAHVDFTDREKNPIVFWTFVVMTTLLLGTLSVFIPHTFLWFQRTLVGRLKNPRGPHGQSNGERMIERFSWIHRFTHALIIISFMGLVATGFPLKYSYTEWAHQFANLFGGIPVMGMIHRVLAVITFMYAGTHAAFLVYFFWKKCPRPIWRYIIGPDSMLFSLRDLKDFIAMVRWFFWLGPRPKFDRWTYFEKFDYFGEIWGVFVIGGTGLMLWFPMLFTRWLPGWVLNCAMVVHSIEALLAASVIFLVHFFNTHLRPEKFPVDMVMFTGQMSEEEMKEERGQEYDRLVKEGILESRIVEPMALKWRILGAILGIIAFVSGIVLIYLAIRTEFTQFFG